MHVRAAAMKALALDPTLSEAHASLASVLLAEDWDFAAAERAFQRAWSSTRTTSRPIISDRAHYLLTVGRIKQATVEVQRILELDPFSLLPITTSDTTLGTLGSMTKPFDIMRATRLPTRKNRIPTGRWATSTLSRGCQRRRLRRISGSIP